MSEKQAAILETEKNRKENYKKEALFMPKDGRCLQDRAGGIEIDGALRDVIVPG